MLSGDDPVNSVEEFCQGIAWPDPEGHSLDSWCLCLLLSSCLFAKSAGQRE